MTDNFEISRPDSSTLMVRLKKPEMLDPEIFGRIENDLNLLPCALSDRKRGILTYTTEHLIPLRVFLEQYSFSQTEGYQFLIGLLKKAAAINRSKPVLLSLDTIFCTPYGEEVRFASVPVALEYWMFQKEDNERLVRDICGNFITADAYEIIGYLMRLCQSESFSLMAAAAGLEDLENAYYPRSFWLRNKPYPPFRAKRAVRENRLDDDWKPSFPNDPAKTDPQTRKQADFISASMKSAAPSNAAAKRAAPSVSKWPADEAGQKYKQKQKQKQKQKLKPKQRNESSMAAFCSRNPAAENLPGLPAQASNSQNPYGTFFAGERTALQDPVSYGEKADECKTRLLIENENEAWLEFGPERFSLDSDEVSIGRHPDNPVRLKNPDISGVHAKIVRENGRWYLIARSKTNGTWLNDHPVKRKMRLKDGMVIRLSSREGVFHEQTVSV